MLSPISMSWCCRVCTKCMCDSYGVCASASVPTPMARVQSWTNEEVGLFAESLADLGIRNTCPAGCQTPSLFNGSRSRFASMSGAALHDLLEAQSAFEKRLRDPNTTSAAERANASNVRAEYAKGLLPPHAQPARVALAFFNRLHTAVRDFSHAAGAHLPAAPPPPPLPIGAKEGQR